MSRSRYRIFDTTYPYFLTCTIVGWLPVFTRPEMVEIVFESWRFLQRDREFEIFGYVVLENHLHIIAAAPKLAEEVKCFKMFTARRMIDRLERLGAETLLRQLRAHKLPNKTASNFQVWQEGSHPQQIGDAKMMQQKLEYMHLNPLKRGYVDDPCHWRYSSARNYAGGTGLIEVVTDWM